MITYGSVCSGIEAVTVAWHDLGFVPSWFSEIEKFPSAVLSHHYPHVPNLGDMTKISDKILKLEAYAPDILIGGTPCQAFSVAGLRGGISDARGQLTLSFVQLGNQIDATRMQAGKQPSIIVWENVPGVLSSKDNAFGCFLAALAGESEPLLPSGKKWANAGYVVGPQRTISWRILDSQYFGVAQRRRRVFVIASARDDFDTLATLFEFEGLRRDIAPSRSAGEEIAGTIGARTGLSLGTQDAQCGHLIPFTPSAFAQYAEGVGTLKSSGGDIGGGSETLLVYALAGNTIGRQPMNGGNHTGYDGTGSTYTLTATDLHAVVKIYEEENLTHVRRLTCVECERLQGFPDNYTFIPFRNKLAADGPRYKALGNSMAVPVMQWLGVRIYLKLLGLL